jgi:hypothetical protein
VILSGEVIRILLNSGKALIIEKLAPIEKELTGINRGVQAKW